MTSRAFYDMYVTTQGPSYPPSEVMDVDGNFIVIGRVNRVSPAGAVFSEWSRAIVSASSKLPAFGQNLPYDIIRELADPLDAADAALVLHTLPLPLPCSNYPMVFAPSLGLGAYTPCASHAFHETPIADLRPQDGRKLTAPITLGAWCQARGRLEVSVPIDRRSGHFSFEFSGLVPNSLYTMMALRQRDLDPLNLTRPGPLGVPNVLLADASGSACYQASLPNPFPADSVLGGNRVVNVILLWMSYQVCYGGAIGRFGLGADIHAQLKLPGSAFHSFETVA